jgi:hypothetical protein
MNRRPFRLESGVMSGMIDLVSSAGTVILALHDLDAIPGRRARPAPRSAPSVLDVACSIPIEE